MICRECYKLTSKILDKFCRKCGKGIINFGKYRNYTFMYVMITDSEYCDWVTKNIQEDIPENIKDFLNFLKQAEK